MGVGPRGLVYIPEKLFKVFPEGDIDRKKDPIFWTGVCRGVSKLDKEKGILHFYCKSIWGSHTKKVYWNNGGHFLICYDIDKQSILQKFNTFFFSLRNYLI